MPNGRSMVGIGSCLRSNDMIVDCTFARFCIMNGSDALYPYGEGRDGGGNATQLFATREQAEKEKGLIIKILEVKTDPKERGEGRISRMKELRRKAREEQPGQDERIRRRTEGQKIREIRVDSETRELIPISRVEIASSILQVRSSPTPSYIGPSLIRSA